MLVARIKRPGAQLVLDNAPSPPKIEQMTLVRIILPLEESEVDGRQASLTGSVIVADDPIAADPPVTGCQSPRPRHATMIETHELTKMYGELYALNRLNLTLNQGDVYGFIGPNGAGKTTTMRILATLLNPSWGEATVCGYSIYTGSKEIRRVIGYMPDFFGVYDDMKVIEYLEFFASAYRIKGAARRKICEEVLELVDLTYKRDALVTSLSRGMTQRLGLARTLLHDPQVLLLDEPASGPRSPRPHRDARLAQRAAQHGQDDPGLQPHPPRAGGHLQQDRDHRAGLPARQRRGRRRDEAGPHRHRAEHRRRRPVDRRRRTCSNTSPRSRASRTRTAS